MRANAAKGDAYETSIARKTGIKKNTESISFANKEIVPDFVTDKLLIEAKSGVRVGGTKNLNQLRLYSDYALENGLNMQIWVTPGATFSPRIAALISERDIDVVRWQP